MAPRTSLSRDELVHRISERKLESGYRQPLCLVKEHLVLQSAGNDRNLEIRQRRKKGREDLSKITELTDRGEIWKGIWKNTRGNKKLKSSTVLT